MINLQRLKKTAFLESAVYNPNNYSYNTNYNREFSDKVRSEGGDFLRELDRNRKAVAALMKQQSRDVNPAGQSSLVIGKSEFMSEKEVSDI